MTRRPSTVATPLTVSVSFAFDLIKIEITPEQWALRKRLQLGASRWEASTQTILPTLKPTPNVQARSIGHALRDQTITLSSTDGSEVHFGAGLSSDERDWLIDRLEAYRVTGA